MLCPIAILSIPAAIASVPIAILLIFEASASSPIAIEDAPLALVVLLPIATVLVFSAVTPANPIATLSVAALVVATSEPIAIESIACAS